MAKRMKDFGFWIAAIFLLAHPVFSEPAALPKEAQQALEKTAAWKNYKADFTLDAKEEDGKTFQLRGTMIFQKPERRRLEIREGDAKETTQLLVSDGRVEWQYYPKNHAAYRINQPPEAPGPHRPFEEVKPESVRFVQRVEGPEPLLRFEGEPLPKSVEGSPVPIRRVRLDVSEKDGMLRELVMLDEQGNPALTQRFTHVELDVSVPAGQFTFTPPEGVSVTEAPAAAKED